MGCYSCSQKKNLLQYFVASTKTPVAVNCTNELNQILELETRMRCIMRTTKNSVLNAALGKLLSMRNLKDYCRFDLKEINTILDGYGGC